MVLCSSALAYLTNQLAIVGAVADEYFHGSIRFQFHLPRQQTRQQQVVRPAEHLDWGLIVCM